MQPSTDSDDRRRRGQGRRSCGRRDNPQQQMAPRCRGSWPSLLCTDVTHAVSRVPLSVAVRSRSLWVASPGVLGQPHASLGRFLGRRPFLRPAIARWQEATDPQSPEGGGQRACKHGGCPPRGFWAACNGS